MEPDCPAAAPSLKFHRMTDAETEPGREPEIATGTLAEIYAQQGLYERALEIYRRIERRRPDDPHVSRRIADLVEARERREAEATRDEPGTPQDPPLEDAARTAPAEAAEGDIRGGGPAPSSEDDEEFRSWLERR